MAQATCNNRTPARTAGRLIRLAYGWIAAAIICGVLVIQRPHFEPWQFMWLTAVTVFALCKMLTLLNVSDPGELTTARVSRYLFLWPGLCPGPFLLRGGEARTGGENLWAAGSRNLFVGLVLLAAALVTHPPWWLKAWLGMAGFSLLVHFGLFDLLTACWRRVGVPVEKLFVNPLAARSLGDFWGRRWNRAFSAFARELIFRPLARPLGATAAGLSVFLFSGLVHELAISVPAGGGYGGPTVYFVLQGILVLVENTRWFRATLGSRPVCRWLGTATAVVGPVPLLFHAPFLRAVVLPFLSALGGEA